MKTQEMTEKRQTKLMRIIAIVTGGFFALMILAYFVGYIIGLYMK